MGYHHRLRHQSPVRCLVVGTRQPDCCRNQRTAHQSALPRRRSTQPKALRHNGYRTRSERRECRPHRGAQQPLPGGSPQRTRGFAGRHPGYQLEQRSRETQPHAHDRDHSGGGTRAHPRRAHRAQPRARDCRGSSSGQRLGAGGLQRCPCPSAATQRRAVPGLHQRGRHRL